MLKIWIIVLQNLGFPAMLNQIYIALITEQYCLHMVGKQETK